MGWPSPSRTLRLPGHSWGIWLSSSRLLLSFFSVLLLGVSLCLCESIFPFPHPTIKNAVPRVGSTALPRSVSLMTRRLDQSYSGSMVVTTGCWSRMLVSIRKFDWVVCRSAKKKSRVQVALLTSCRSM